RGLRGLTSRLRSAPLRLGQLVGKLPVPGAGALELAPDAACLPLRRLAVGLALSRLARRRLALSRVQLCRVQLCRVRLGTSTPIGPAPCALLGRFLLLRGL